MKNIIRLLSYSLLTALISLMSCRDDAYDGLQDIDPAPANAVTFPDATVDGFTYLDDNAFIINQNALSNGRVEVRIKGPDSKQITALEVKAQRFRGAIAAPNISPTLPATTLRAPTAFSRTAASLQTVNVTPGSEVTYTLDINALPAALTKTALGAVQAPAGENPQYDVFRFFFIVTYNDGSTVVSNEVRVVVRG